MISKLACPCGTVASLDADRRGARAPVAAEPGRTSKAGLANPASGEPQRKAGRNRMPGSAPGAAPRRRRLPRGTRRRDCSADCGDCAQRRCRRATALRRSPPEFGIAPSPALRLSSGARMSVFDHRGLRRAPFATVVQPRESSFLAADAWTCFALRWLLPIPAVVHYRCRTGPSKSPWPYGFRSVPGNRTRLIGHGISRRSASTNRSER